MRPLLASLVVVALWSASASGDEPPRLIQIVGMDMRTLEPVDAEEGHTVSFFTRATYAASAHLRGGLEMGVGPACLSSSLPKARSVAVDLSRESVFYYAGLVFGVSFGGPWLSAGAEVLVGARGIDTDLARMVEPRLTAELWLAPDVSLGARAGADLLGLYLAVYTW